MPSAGFYSPSKHQANATRFGLQVQVGIQASSRLLLLLQIAFSAMAFFACREQIRKTLGRQRGRAAESCVLNRPALMR